MTGTGVMAAMAVVSTGVGVYGAATAKQPGGGGLPPLPQSQANQASKLADKSTADTIKSAKKRSGVATPNTLLTGSQGIIDEDLNLGQSGLV